MIYLDNSATTCIKPNSVVNAVNYTLKNLSANPGRSGYEISNKAAMLVYNCRKEIKELVNAKSENNVCFTMNCTHAINTVLEGVLKAGDHIIISSLEHNAVVRPIFSMYNENKIQYSVANVFDDEQETIKDFEKKIRSNTKMIMVTAASNVTGRVLPLKKIGNLCKKYNLLFAVDGAQGVGIIPIDMNEMNIDYLCVAPHKGLYAPMGIGVLVAQNEIEKVLIKGGTGINSLEITQPEELPERIESGTINLPGIAGVASGAKFVKEKGIENIYSHEIKLCRYLYYNLLELKADLYTEEPQKYMFAPVVSFNLKPHNSEYVGKVLANNNIAVRTGFHCAPLAHKSIGTIDKGTVRVSTSIFNSYNDIDRLIFTLKRVI